LKSGDVIAGASDCPINFIWEGDGVGLKCIIPGSQAYAALYEF